MGQEMFERHQQEDDEFFQQQMEIVDPNQNSQPLRKNLFGEPSKSSARKKNSPKLKSAQGKAEYRMLTRK